jgi:hypothetical protein
VSPHSVSEPEQAKPEEEVPSAGRPVIFREPEVTRHPTEAKIRLEQRIALVGREQELKHGSVIELPCSLDDLEASAALLRGVERQLRDDLAFRRKYLRTWQRPEREPLEAALAQADALKGAGR